jgi:hypothetical protein
MSAAVNRKKKQRSYTSYTVKQEKTRTKTTFKPTHENDAVLQKRPESYQNKVKNVILPKANQKKVNYFEESNNKLPTPIRKNKDHILVIP